MFKYLPQFSENVYLKQPYHKFNTLISKILLNFIRIQT